MSYLIRTAARVFGMLLGISLGLVFGLPTIGHLVDVQLGLVGAFVAWPLGGLITWRFLPKRPIDAKDDIAHYWIKKFLVMTILAGSIASPWSFIANTSMLNLSGNPFAALFVNATSGFAWPIGYAVAWKAAVQNRPVPEKYITSYYWAKRVIFIIMALTVLPIITYAGVLFHVFLPFPFGTYLIYPILAIFLAAAIRFAFRNFRPEN